MNRYVYVQAGMVNQCNPARPEEAHVSFRFVMVSAYSVDGAYVEGQKHQWTGGEGEFDGPFAILNDLVIPV